VTPDPKLKNDDVSPPSQRAPMSQRPPVSQRPPQSERLGWGPHDPLGAFHMTGPVPEPTPSSPQV
jgi:hypothetical protein